MKAIDIIKVTVVAVCMSVATTSTAQALHTGYFLESSVQRHELNAAFGGEANYFMLPLLGGVETGVHTNMGLGNYVFERNGQMVTGLSSQVSAADFLGALPEHQRLNFNFELPILSVGFRAFGGFNTIVAKSRTNVDFSLPSSIMAFIKQGQDPATGVAHYDIDNLGINAAMYTELALGHSRKLPALEGFSYGAKLKFLFGMVNASMQIQHIGLDLSRNSWNVTADGTAYVSNNVVTTRNADGELEEVSIAMGLAGFGMGVDLGVAYTPAALPDLTVSVGVNDIGFITWNNMNKSVAKNSFEYEGFDNIGAEDASLEEQLDDLLESVSDLVVLEDAGNINRTAKLNTTLNVGAEYAFLKRLLSVGLLSSTRFGAPYTYTEGMLVLNVRPLSWLHLAFNGSYSTYGAGVGAMLNICPNGFNLFVGCDYFAPSMRFSNDLIPINPVNANVRVGIAFPIGKI